MKFLFKKPFKIFVFLAVFSVFPFKTFAIPQYSLLTGNKCLNCHVNNQGGGIRNELGWYASQGTGFIKPESVGLGFINELESNAYFDGLLTLGMDVRVQSARSYENADTERKLFPMQVALYAAVKATDWATVEGSYNAGPIRYSGQKAFTASAILQPTFDYPQLRVGFFQPSIGMRYDDHTMLVRQTAVATDKGTQSLIAPNYAELGGELTYDAQKWLTVTAGAFSANSLAENSVQDTSGGQTSIITDKNNPSLLGRVVFWPRLFENAFNTYIGASALKNGDFLLANVFGGIGLTDRVSLMAEYAMSDKTGLQETQNVSAELTYQIVPPLLAYIRAENATTNITASGQSFKTTVRQYVFGAQIFPFPFVEIRPEYRIFDTEKPEYTSRYAVQLHVFY